MMCSTMLLCKMNKYTYKTFKNKSNHRAMCKNHLFYNLPAVKFFKDIHEEKPSSITRGLFLIVFFIKCRHRGCKLC